MSGEMARHIDRMLGLVSGAFGIPPERLSGLTVVERALEILPHLRRWPAESPRPSKGWRRHVRRCKAADKRRATCTWYAEGGRE